MLTISLTENRSTPKRYVAITRYERYGDKVVAVRVIYDGPGHCCSSKVITWPRKDWTTLLSGEIGSHGRAFTAKRDWIALHASLAMERA